MPRNVPPPAEGSATPVEVTFQRNLALRTLAKLSQILEVEYDEDKGLAAKAALEESFREANCDASLFDCQFLDLAGNTRLRGVDHEGAAVMIPVQAMPEVGTIINWQGMAYYIAEHHS